MEVNARSLRLGLKFLYGGTAMECRAFEVMPLPEWNTEEVDATEWKWHTQVSEESYCFEHL